MKFRTILADPPWPYPKGMIPSLNNKNLPAYAGNTTISCNDIYPTLSIDEICALPVEQHTYADSHLYLWVTNAFVDKGFEVCRAWGFKPITLLTWGKVKKTNENCPSMKCGYYYRSATEHIIFGSRGCIELNPLMKCQSTLHLQPREPHSCKPDYFYKLIEKASYAPRLEMFARKPREGWQQWGNEFANTFEFESG